MHGTGIGGPGVRGSGGRPPQEQVPLDRFAEPDDIAKVMEFLVTDLSDYVTGQNIPVCGGAINF